MTENKNFQHVFAKAGKPNGKGPYFFTLMSVCVEACPRRRPDGQDEEDAGPHCALHLPGPRRPPHQPLHRCTGLRSCAAPTINPRLF
jgi:hypothetical protein